MKSNSLKSRTRWITEKCFLLSDIDMLDKVLKTYYINNLKNY